MTSVTTTTNMGTLHEPVRDTKTRNRNQVGNGRFPRYFGELAILEKLVAAYVFLLLVISWKNVDFGCITAETYVFLCNELIKIHEDVIITDTIDNFSQSYGNNFIKGTCQTENIFSDLPSHVKTLLALLLSRTSS